MSEITLKEVEVQKLNLGPNDFLVVKVGNSEDFDASYLDSLRKGLSHLDVKGIIVKSGEENGIDFSVVRQSKNLKVKIKKLHPDAVVPQYQTIGASGFDLHALEDVTIFPGQTQLVKTGLSFEIPEGFEMQVRPRSGMSFKTPIRIANAPGTVDADFRGEVCVIASFHPFDHFISYTIKKGYRIAQGVVCPVVKAEFEVVEELEDTQRGFGGFGSSGT